MPAAQSCAPAPDWRPGLTFDRLLLIVLATLGLFSIGMLVTVVAHLGHSTLPRAL